MDLADTMVSSKTQRSRMSDGAAAISFLLADGGSALIAAPESLLSKKLPRNICT